jgi:hypothetical protein
LEDENGDPITEHKNIILMYKRILNCSWVGMVQQQLIHYLNDKKTFVQTYHWQPVQSFIWESAYWPATTSQPPRWWPSKYLVKMWLWCTYEAWKLRLEWGQCFEGNKSDDS